MVTENELAFLKAHLAELSPTVLKQLKQDIVAEQRREAEATAKAKGPGERPMDTNPDLPGRGLLSPTRSPEPPREAQGQRVGLVRLGRFDGAMAPGPMPGAGSVPPPAQAKGTPAQGRWVNPPLSRANKPRLAAGYSATLRLARRTLG
jgi:hypothetical protein